MVPLPEMTRQAIRSLPNKEGLKNDVVVMGAHRNPYDGAMKVVGGKFDETENAIEPFPWDLDSVITEKL